MKRTRFLLCTAMAVAVILGLYAIQGSHAQSKAEYVPEVKITSLIQGPLAGVAGKDVIIKHFELPPNFVGGKHWHPGPVFVYILEGELTVETEGGVQTLKAGQLYQETLNQTMQAKNMSTTTAAKIVVFQVGDAGKPMMVKAQ